MAHPFGRRLAMPLLSAGLLVAAWAPSYSGQPSVHPVTLALPACGDTNVNFFIASSDARALVPAAIGEPIVTSLFLGDTTPVNIAHFHCTDAMLDGQRLESMHFALVRVGLKPNGHYIVLVQTDARQLHELLQARGIASHLVRDASLDVTADGWRARWGGEAFPYSVTVHQVRAISAGPGPVVEVPPGTVLRTFVDAAHGVTALTHRDIFELTVGVPH